MQAWSHHNNFNALWTSPDGLAVTAMECQSASDLCSLQGKLAAAGGGGADGGGGGFWTTPGSAVAGCTS